MLDAKQIIADLRALGVKGDDTIIVHSSYNALKGDEKIENGPEAVISALKETVKNGTLMLPTLSWEAVTIENPRFNALETESCVGILPEFMRKSPDVIRSVHPTHSVAIWGRDAQKIADVHLRDFTPVGANSPFREVARRRGKIVMLGNPLETNTTMHGVEEMVVPPYLYSKNNDYELTTSSGEKLVQGYLRHGFTDAVEQRYERIVNLLDKNECKTGKVLNASCTVMDAAAVWTKGLKKLREDIFYFVDMN